jgi:hypothetical protein
MSEPDSSVFVPSRYQLHLDLPSAWSILDMSVVRRALSSIEADTIDVSWNEVGLLLAVDALEPDVVAVLSLPLIDTNDTPCGLLLASLLVVTMPYGDVPSLDDESFKFRVIDGVKGPSGHPLTFAVQTLPIVSDDHEMVSLLTFSSPNTPLGPILQTGFVAIADSSWLAQLTEELLDPLSSRHYLSDATQRDRPIEEDPRSFSQ